MKRIRNEQVPDRAPLLRVFGSLSPQVAKLVRLQPALAQRFTFAPPEAIHAVAMFLHRGAEHADGLDTVAEKIASTHPRVLLASTCPYAPPGFYRALARAGDVVREQSL